MPSPEAGATTPAASPAITTLRPLSQRRRGFIGNGAPSRRMVSAPAKPTEERSELVALRKEKPLSALPVPMLKVSPCGNTQP